MDDFSTSMTSVATSISTKSTTLQSVQNVYSGAYMMDEDDSYKQIFKLLIQTSIPKILSSFLSVIIITINIIWIGHNFSTEQFAGALLAITTISITLNIAIMSLTSGLEKYFDYSYRSQLYKMVGTFIQRYMVIIHIIIVILAALLFYFSKEILIYIFGQSHSNSHYASIYIHIFIVAFWAMSMYNVLCQYIQSFSVHHNNIFVSISLFIAICLEIPLTYLSINQFKLGLQGAAISIVITYYIALISLFIISKCHPNIHQNISLTYPGCGHWIFNMTELKIYFKHSFKKAIYISFELCMLEIYVFIAGRFSTEYICSYVISLNILKLFQRISYGISATATILIKQRLFNGNGDAARRIWNVSIIINIITVSILTAVMLTFTDSLASIYTSHENIVQQVKKTLPFSCLFFFFDSLLRSFISGMYGLCRESMTTIIFLICYYCFGFPLGIIYGFKGFLSINDPRFRHINGLWLGASCGIFVSLCIFILIRLRVNWQSEVRRFQKLLHEIEINTEKFRNRMISKYGRYSTYGINSGLIDDDYMHSPSSNDDNIFSSGHYDWSTSENIIREDDSQNINFSSKTKSGHYVYYDVNHVINYKQRTNSDNVDESIEDNTDRVIGHNSNAQRIQNISINDVRIGPFANSAASSMGRSMPQSVGPPTRDYKHGPIVI